MKQFNLWGFVASSKVDQYLEDLEHNFPSFFLKHASPFGPGTKFEPIISPRDAQPAPFEQFLVPLLQQHQQTIASTFLNNPWPWEPTPKSEEPHPDLIGVYLGFHGHFLPRCHDQHWGIYLSAEHIFRFAARLMTMALPFQVNAQDALVFARRAVWEHEFYHHLVESDVLNCELIVGKQM